MRHYLSVCAIYLDETPYLREWLEFHRLVGVEHFFLYDNGNTDDHLEVLAPYLDDGTVTLHEWPMRPGQRQAYDHCLQTRGDTSRWISFIDLDEFLFSPTFEPLPTLLVDYERHPGVVVNWAMFGTSGHVTRPAGLVTENHHYRKDYTPDSSELVKSIVDPRRTERARSPHVFVYRDGFAVNEHHVPKDGPPLGFFKPVSFERFRINHYAHRSEQEYRSKLSRPQAHSGKFKNLPEQAVQRRMRKFNAVRDDTIKSYLPALRKALASVEEIRPSAGGGAPSSART